MYDPTICRPAGRPHHPPSSQLAHGRSPSSTWLFCCVDFMNINFEEEHLCRKIPEITLPSFLGPNECVPRQHDVYKRLQWILLNLGLNDDNTTIFRLFFLCFLIPPFFQKHWKEEGDGDKKERGASLVLLGCLFWLPSFLLYFLSPPPKKSPQNPN